MLKKKIQFNTKYNNHGGLDLIVIVLLVLAVVGVGSYYVFQRISDNNENSSVAKIVENDCTSYEKYDEETDECYFECDTEVECDEIEAKIEAELNSYFEDTETRVSTITNNKEHQARSDSEQTVYNYSNGRLSPNIVDEIQKQVWSYFSVIASREYLDKYITQVGFFDDADDTTMAYVVQNDNDSLKWNVVVNLAYKDDQKELLMTLVHEFMHIVTLNHNQVDVNGSVSCDTLSFSEGCAKEGSYIAMYGEQFWPGVTTVTEEGGDERYSIAPNDYVSAYAATSVLEDFAETFSFYTLKSDNIYSGVAKQKIDFMDKNKDLKALATRIRANLGNELIHAKQITDDTIDSNSDTSDQQQLDSENYDYAEDMIME